MALIGITVSDIETAAVNLREIASILDIAAGRMRDADVESLDLQFVYYGQEQVEKMLTWAEGVEAKVKSGIRVVKAAKSAAAKADSGEPLDTPDLPFKGEPPKRGRKKGAGS